MPDIGKRPWFPSSYPFVFYWFARLVNNPSWKDWWRPHWFQETQLVNDSDVLQGQAALGSFSLRAGLPCSSCVWVRAHAVSWDYMPGARLCLWSADRAPSLKPPSFQRGQEWPLSSRPLHLGMLGCYLPGRVPLLRESCGVSLMAPSAPWLKNVYSTLFWRETASPCGFAVEPTSCLCFSQLWNITKSNRVGRWLLPGKRAISLSTMVEEATVSVHQELCLCGLHLRDARTLRQQIHINIQMCVVMCSHACTHTHIHQ